MGPLEGAIPIRVPHLLFHLSHLYKFLQLCGLPKWLSGKKPTCQCRRRETWVQSLGQEDPLKEGMATLSSILSWKIPWIEEPGGLPSMGSQRVGQD